MMERRAWVALAGCGLLAACGSEAPGVDECSNLRTIQAEAGGSIMGKFGTLEDYEFAASGDGSYNVVPPDASDCARDIAARLEAACRICRESEAACESTVTQVLDTPTQFCTACGDDLCGGDETPANCPQDCADACGNGQCEGTESAQSCPTDCAQSGCGDGVCAPGETPVNCANDCDSACGDGRCVGDESPTSCPHDCDIGECGDSRCNFGETAENCRVDCGAGCGNGQCEASESGLICPADCGGCEPQTSTCQGSALIACNADGQSTTSRSCGVGSNCREGVCRAADPAAGQEEAERQMLGFWRAQVDLNGDQAPVVGEIYYTLEVFQVSPPEQAFGVWPWKGALKPAGLCLLDAGDLAAGGGVCQPLEGSALGTCSGASCTARGSEVAIQGTWNAVDRTITIDPAQRADGDAFHFDAASGYVAVRLEVYGSGPVADDRLLPSACAGVHCNWSTEVAPDTPLGQRFAASRGDGWSLGLEKITAQ